MRHFYLGFVAVFCVTPVLAQTAAEPVKLGPVTLTGSIRSRMESWQWFEANSGDSSYTFLGNQIRLGLSENGKKADWLFEDRKSTRLNSSHT